MADLDRDIDQTADALPFLLDIEHPLPDSSFSAGGPLTGHGWVLAPDRILSIAVLLNGAPLCQASIGIGRDDVSAAYPEYPANQRAGFVFWATLPSMLSCEATLRFVVRTAAELRLRDIPIRIIGNAPAPGRAAARLEPIRLELEEVTIAPSGALHLHGWTVGALPIRSVEILLGDETLGMADIHLVREDVARSLSGYVHAVRPGFQFDGTLALDDAPLQERLSVVVTDAAGYGRTAAILIDVPARPKPALPEAMLTRIEESRVSERGILRVRGWVLSLADIETIEVFLGAVRLGRAQSSLPRNDVAEAHPDYPNAGAAGFLLQQEVTDDLLTEAEVRVVVTAVGGITRELAAPLAVPQAIKRVQSREVTHCFFDSVSLTEDGLLRGIGWAVCPTGVDSITLTLGAHDAGQAEIGLDRPDVGNRFSSIPSARRAGFRFSVALPARFEGEHILQLTVRGMAGEQHSVLQPVRALGVQEAPAEPQTTGAVQADADAEKIKFYLDIPAVRDGRALEPVRGFMVMNGWAISRAGIDAIEVSVDGHPQGRAYYGIRREEVQAAFPERDALLSGFAMMIPPQVLKRGRHDVQIVLRDKAGHVEQQMFSVEAEPLAEGPGPWQLRAKIPRSEIDLQCAILSASGWRPAWVLALPLADDGPGQIKAARQTLASLRHQAWPGWRLRVQMKQGADRDEVAAALLAGFDDLAGHVDVVADAPETLFADLAPHDGMLALLAPGDRLGEDALLEMSVEAAVQADAGGRPDFLYSDERRTDPSDGAAKAFFKPDFSPDLLLSTNYIGRLWAASPALLRRAGLTLGDLAANGAYDCVLRLTEQAARIVHVRKVLCANESGVEDAGSERRALQRAAQRRSIAADIRPGCIAGTWRLKREVSATGLVSIIMPTIASRGLVKITIESIRAMTAWPRVEIIVLDNIVAGDDPEKRRWKEWLREAADTVIDIDEPFNWSRFNNLGAAQALGDYLLFLNDDIEMLNEGWLHALIEHAQRPEVGVVGPQLLYPDGTVQHAGVFLSRNVGRHAFRFYPRDAPGPFGLALTQRNVISVTGACMLMRRDVFDELGGFDENFSVINNDLDFSLRVRRSGRRVVYTPHATMIHHEMVSRSKLKDVYDSAKFDAAWKDLFLQGDPYFHPMLTSDYDDYLSEPEPLRQFQVGHPLIARYDVRRILAVKVDHIGDFVAAFPAFRRIKQHFPQAELCVLAAKASLALAAMEPSIDRVEEFNFFHARSELGRLASAEQELLDLEARLAPFRFDIALDLRRQPDTRKILQHTGARWLAGFDQDYAHPWLDITMEFEGDVARNFKRSHVSDSLVQFVDTVARACETDRRGLQSPPAAAQARAELAAHPALGEFAANLFARRVVCVHTGAGAANKQWPAKSFAGLIDLLVGELSVNVMIIGGPDEAAFADTVMEDVRRAQQVYSLVGKTSLKTLPTALLACDLYVGNDSGPKHMAAALGVPTIGIHSGSVDAGEWGPMGEQTLTIRRDMTCGPCYIAYAEDCPRSMACLNGIAVGDVFRACQRMLALRPA